MTGLVPRLRVGAWRRRAVTPRIGLSRNVLCPAPPCPRPKYRAWPLPSQPRAGGGRCLLWKASSGPVPGSARKRGGGILTIQVEPDL